MDNKKAYVLEKKDVRVIISSRGYSMMKYSATKLRQNLYAILDSVLETGNPVEIERKGRIIKIIPEEKRSIWDNLEEHDIVVCNSDQLVSSVWTNEKDTDWKSKFGDIDS